MNTFRLMQQVVYQWGLRCFGIAHIRDAQVRGLRFVEEAIELCQVLGVPQAQVSKCVRVVYSRPVGELYQEVGGVLVTLSIIAEIMGVDLETAFYHEVQRCLSKDPEHFTKRNEEKIQLGLTGGA